MTPERGGNEEAAGTNSEAVPFFPQTPEVWRRVGELFDQAIELAPEKRDAWLQKASAGDEELRKEVHSLLESDRHAHQEPLEARVRESAGALLEESREFQAPERAGPYRLIRELGRGGMGAVYLGRRDDEQYQIDVAVKLVNPGTGNEFTVQRFRRERQILASLDHPNIARLLDGGATEGGLPYIVMEYIDGARITDSCRERRLNADQMLPLFLQVCAAVEHAHRNFVVHRDIKPGNILVARDGTPKLLDFGISKLLDSEPARRDETVAAGIRLLTPDYASPEQIRGEQVTIVSDVYSLGAVLYELLTGTKPHQLSDLSLTEIERVVCEEDVRRPSLAAAHRAAARRLEGDLDTILLRALDKDPLRRYRTVTEFADDLRRHLAHLPVLARPDTITYRVRKFVRRRSGTVAAVAAVAASLIAGTAVALNQARIANERLQQVRRLANTFVFDVHDAVRDLPGSTKARRLIVETGLQYLDSLAATARSDASLQNELASAYLRIGEIQGDSFNANLGKVDDAARSFDKARGLLEAVLNKDPTNFEARKQMATVLYYYGHSDYDQRNLAKALERFEEVERMGEPLLREHPGDEALRRLVSESYSGVALMRRRLGEQGRAVKAAARGLTILRESPAAAKPDRELRYLILSGIATLGNYELLDGKVDQGLGHLRESAAGLDQLIAEAPDNSLYLHQQMLTWSHIADVLVDKGDDEGAPDAAERFVTIARKLSQADKADARAESDLGIALTRLAGILPEAQFARRETILREAIALLQTTTRKNPKNVQGKMFLAVATIIMGDSFAAGKNPPRAILLWTEGVAMGGPLLGAGQISLAEAYVYACQRLGEDAAARGDRRAAEDFANKAGAVTAIPGENAKLAAPRMLAAQGMVYARLARSGPDSAADRTRALDLLGKSVQGWQGLAQNASLPARERRQLREAETEVAALGRR